MDIKLSAARNMKWEICEKQLQLGLQKEEAVML